MKVNNAFVCPAADGPNEDEVRPSNWNDDLVVTYSVQAITTTANLDATKDVIRLAAGTYTVTVPAASGSGKMLQVCQDGAGVITLARSESDTIGGATSKTMTVAGSMSVLVDEASGVWGFLRSDSIDLAQGVIPAFSSGAATIAPGTDKATVYQLAADRTLSQASAITLSTADSPLQGNHIIHIRSLALGYVLSIVNGGALAGTIATIEASLEKPKGVVVYYGGSASPNWEFVSHFWGEA